MSLDNQDFKNWKDGQDLDHWHSKYSNKCHNAIQENIRCLLTFEEYIYKAFEAGLISPNQIGSQSQQYNLGRLNDEGDYTVDSCRFITKQQNRLEDKNMFVLGKYYRDENWRKQKSDSSSGHTNSQGVKHWNCKLTEEQVVKIYLSQESYNILANEFGTTSANIHKIKSGYRWSHVTKNLKDIKNVA